MTAVASMGGVIAATEPGGIVTSAPWTADLSGGDGMAPQPWYNPRSCSLPSLALATHKLVSSAPMGGFAGLSLLLDSDDFDLTFTVDYTVANGHADDVQLHFRDNACNEADEHYFWATAPQGGNTSTSIFHASGGSQSNIATTTDARITEGSTQTWRIHVHGTTCDVYLDADVSPLLSVTVNALAGQRSFFFGLDNTGTKIYAVSLA